MKTLVKPQDVTLTQPKLDLKNFDRFLDQTDLFFNHCRIVFDFKKSLAVVDIGYYSNFKVLNIKSKYSGLLEQDLILQNFEVIIYFGGFDSQIRYIAAKRESYDEYLKFLKDISKRHRFTDTKLWELCEQKSQKLETKELDAYFIDSEKLDLEIDIQKEKIKIEKFKKSLESGKIGSVPRLKHEKHDLKFDIKIEGYFFRGFKNLTEKQKEKLFSHIKSIKSEFLFCHAIYNMMQKSLTFEELSKLENLGAKFNDDPNYQRIKKIQVFETIGD
jgi:hypothetical protein